MDGWGRNRFWVVGIRSGSNGALGYRSGAKRCFGVYLSRAANGRWGRVLGSSWYVNLAACRLIGRIKRHLR